MLFYNRSFQHSNYIDTKKAVYLKDDVFTIMGSLKSAKIKCLSKIPIYSILLIFSGGSGCFCYNTLKGNTSLFSMASHGCVGIIATILNKYILLCFSEGGVDPASHGAGMEDRFYNNKSFQVRSHLNSS